jgi:hypothetical protein
MQHKCLKCLSTAGGFIVAADLLRSLEPCPEDLEVEFVHVEYCVLCAELVLLLFLVPQGCAATRACILLEAEAGILTCIHAPLILDLLGDTQA